MEQRALASIRRFLLVPIFGVAGMFIELVLKLSLRSTPVITRLTVGLLGSVAFSAQVFAQASSFDTKTGEELYRAGCAACHGPDGTGTLARDASVVLARSAARVP